MCDRNALQYTYRRSYLMPYIITAKQQRSSIKSTANTPSGRGGGVKFTTVNFAEQQQQQQAKAKNQTKNILMIGIPTRYKMVGSVPFVVVPVLSQRYYQKVDSCN